MGKVLKKLSPHSLYENDLRKRASAELELRKRKEKLAEEEKLKVYRNNPLLYFTERLGVNPNAVDWLSNCGYENHSWDGTVNPFAKILEALTLNKWVGVESATGTGKTFNAALIVLWFLECFENAVVVTTAPKEAQLSLHIWKEIGKLYNKFGKGELTSLRLRMNPGRDDRLAIGFVAGVGSAEESSTRAQGFHAENMLIILEETPGISPAVITAFQNTCTAPHNLILALGNPDHQADNLHKFCMLPNVEYVRISAYDHPNVVLNNPLFISGAASREGIERMKARYGEDNPLFLSRARGISPAQSQKSLIQLKWCMDAKERFNPECISGEPALGVDAANSFGGDKAAIARGIGPSLISVIDFVCPDSNRLGKTDVHTAMRDYNIKPDFVAVDAVGVGAGTVNGLKELGLKVYSVFGSAKQEKHKGEEEFYNLRSQMYWKLREDLRNGRISLPNDEELFADLTTPEWEIKNGKITVESKEEIKKRLGHSPNKGDAVVYWNWIRENKGGRRIIKAEVF